MSVTIPEGDVPPVPPGERDARERAAAALRRLGHAVVGHECDPALLEQVAVRADRIAAEVELGTPRSRPVAELKRRMWEDVPPDGGAMSHFAECVVSGRANPMGIAMTVRREGDEAVADVRLGPAFEGAPKRAHGGVVAALFDDIMGYVLVVHRTPAYTGRLTVHYRAPVPMDAPLTLRARLLERDGRKLLIGSQLHVGDDLLCEADGLFVAIPPERLGIGT